ncbi:hypothetical protein Tco_1151236 [Tanacetum coccineum]
MSAGLQITGWPAHDSVIGFVLFGPDETSVFSLGIDGKSTNISGEERKGKGRYRDRETKRDRNRGAERDRLRGRREHGCKKRTENKQDREKSRDREAKDIDREKIREREVKDRDRESSRDRDVKEIV